MISRSRGLIGPSFAAGFAPWNCRGRREGRAPAGTRGSLCVCSASQSCTATYRAARTSRPPLSSGVTAYAVPSPEPNSFCLRRLAKDDGKGRLTSCRRPQGLTVATTVRTTRFCRTLLAPFVTRGQVLTSFGSILRPPCPRPCVPTRARVHRNPPTYRTTRDPSLVPGEMPQYIRQFRISVKRNILRWSLDRPGELFRLTRTAARPPRRERA